MHQQGFLIFAYNNTIDYGTMALCNALLIKKHCAVKMVALVTDTVTLNSIVDTHGEELTCRAFDYIINDNIQHHETWNRTYNDTRYIAFTDLYHNTNRTSAYDLSPFNETILLDADYLILDNSMDLAWGNVETVLCNKTTINLDRQLNYGTSDGRLSHMSIPMYWATAVYFKKTVDAKILFDQMQFVKENYYYYCKLYGFNPNAFFRNDYALSIALHILNGFNELNSVKPLPVDYILVSEEFDNIHLFNSGRLLITSEQEQNKLQLHSVASNIHLMNKQSLIRHSKDIINYAIN